MFHGGSFKNDRTIKDIPAILTQYLLSDQQENEKFSQSCTTDGVSKCILHLKA